MKLLSHLLHDRCIFDARALDCVMLALATRAVESRWSDNPARRFWFCVSNLLIFQLCVTLSPDTAWKFRKKCDRSTRLIIDRTKCETSSWRLSKRVPRWIRVHNETGKFIANNERCWSEREQQNDGPVQYKRNTKYLPATGRLGYTRGSSNANFKKSQLRYRIAGHLLPRHHWKYLESRCPHEKKYARHCLHLHERWAICVCPSLFISPSNFMLP